VNFGFESSYLYLFLTFVDLLFSVNAGIVRGDLPVDNAVARKFSTDLKVEEDSKRVIPRNFSMNLAEKKNHSQKVRGHNGLLLLRNVVLLTSLTLVLECFTILPHSFSMILKLNFTTEINSRNILYFPTERILPLRNLNKRKRQKEKKIEKTVKSEDKKVIAISLKTRNLDPDESKLENQMPGEKKSSGQSNVSKVKKVYDANIDRWFERERERRGKDQVVRSKEGKPVCLLCKRKFVNLKKLDQHEERSSLHKLNLLKYSERVNITEDKAEAHYRDRALERRVLHGPEENGLAMRTCPADDTSQDFIIPEPEENLGENNVGNQILQKLGWKTGSNLGRNPKLDNSDMILKREWEQIETLAKSGCKKARTKDMNSVLQLGRL